MAIPWRLTHLLHSKDYSKTRPLRLNSSIFLYTFGRLFRYSSFILFFLFCFGGLIDYNYIYTCIQQQISIKKAVQGGTTSKSIKLPNDKTIKKVQMLKNSVYGKPIWNTGAARRLRPLRRDFPWEDGTAKAEAKLGSSTKDRLGGLTGGLDTSNLRCNFTGLRVIFLFLLLEGELILLGPGEPRTGGQTCTYSTRPSSTTSNILTPGLDVDSTPWCQRSLVSLAERRRSFSLPCSNFHPKQTRNPHGATLVCSRKGEPARFPQPRHPLPTGTRTKQ